MISIAIKSAVVLLIAAVIPFSGWFLFSSGTTSEINAVEITFEDIEVVSEEDCELSNQTINLMETIECYELAELMESGQNFYLIDVREIDEWNTGYIKGAVLIPFREILNDPAKLPEDKSTPIVLYCKMGSRSANAMRSLKSAGYTNVTNLIQGVMGWTFEGYPLEMPANE